mmetsp:Transcript_18529/g.30467  ORF Transcript_18529/g.30467 Transcript_18529/m.30467 type:complete len:290 (-) Transcript_18529:493-1362(-)|eukprot:CAMPEP_0184664222 /NCGR_PEP_ID=MMETSP0308-20130426/51799_1 /TAXON_ID=38269 /ORGANISM="Gloeochaete witrockiana, Strain SAG 46.84" /LENGTH=289 /DNA_ID=CAMNT_0027107469 /DNA_START=203 /DNA_END=1072 /DNA_ORIENTATION=-
MKLLWAILFVAAVTFPFAYGSVKLTASSQSYLKVPAFPLGGDLTIETWVKLNGPQGSWSRLFDFGTTNDTVDSVTNDLLITFSGYEDRNLQAHLYMPTNAYQLHAAELRLPLNVWFHVAFTIWQFGSAEAPSHYATLYVNGHPFASTVAKGAYPITARDKMFIGKSNWQDPYANINVAEFRIWSYYRFQNDILSLKNYKIRTPMAGLEVNYGFETAATVLVDSSGLSRNALGFNRPVFSTDKPLLKTGTPVAVVQAPQPLCAGPEAAAIVSQIKSLQSQLEALLQTCRG